MEKHMGDTPRHSTLEPLHQWERGWQEHERLQLQRLARLPFADKLAWLEEAHRLVLRIAAAESQRPHPPA